MTEAASGAAPQRPPGGSPADSGAAEPPLTGRALLVLAQCLSPAFPIGGFAYSQGLETAIAEGRVEGAAGLAGWLRAALSDGAARSDAVLLARAWRGDAAAAALALALQPSAERRLESRAQGSAFARAAAAIWPEAEAPRTAPSSEGIALPVAVGRAARALGLPLGPTVALYLQAWASAQVHAGVRLLPLGQTDGQRVLAALGPLIESASAAALATGAEPGGFTPLADIASMRHETQTVRLFRS